MKKQFVILSGIILLSSFLGGCAFSRLKKDVSKIEALKPVSGVIQSEGKSSAPIVVVLVALEEELHAGTGYWVVPQSGAFEFYRSGGSYYLLAYEDANEDGHYQVTEWAGAYGDPSIIDLEGEDAFDDLQIKLLPPGEVEVPQFIKDMSAEEKKERLAPRVGLVGEITTIDNPIFSMDNASMGQWQPLAFAEEFGIKVYFTEPYDPNKTPVLFVHGSVGHPGIWKEIMASMDSDKFQVWLAYYPSGLRLGILGDMYSKHIQELHLRHQFEDLIVVAHSMGGLVSRSMIQKYMQAETRCDIPLYVTISTPWAGHSAAAMGVDHAPAVVPSWFDMVPESPFLKALFASPLPAETAYHLFFSYQDKSGMKYHSENTDGSVALSSELFLPAQEQSVRTMGIDANHVSILSDTNLIQRLNQVLDSQTPKGK